MTTHFEQIEQYLKENLPKRVKEAHLEDVCYTDKFTVGEHIIVPVRSDDDTSWEYQKVTELDSWMISLPVYEDTDPKTLLDCFLARAKEMEQQNYQQFLFHYSLTQPSKPFDVLKKEATCCQLDDWQFLPRIDESGSIISEYGNIALVKYANFACVPEEFKL